MTKKETVNEIMFYYDHRDSNNVFVTTEGRKYKFPELPAYDYRGKTAREQIEKMVKSGMKESKPTYDHNATPSSWFLSAMQKYRDSLKVFLETDKRKRALFKILVSDLKEVREIKFDLRYSDFEWACMTIPRAWLR